MCLPLVDIPGTTYTRLWRWASEWWQTACWCCPAREEAAPQYLEAMQWVTRCICATECRHAGPLHTHLRKQTRLLYIFLIDTFSSVFQKRSYTAENKVNPESAQMSSDLWTAHLQPPSSQRPQWQPAWQWQLLCCWWCCPWWSAGGNTARLPGDNKRVRPLHTEQWA